MAFFATEQNQMPQFPINEHCALRMHRACFRTMRERMKQASSTEGSPWQELSAPQGCLCGRRRGHREGARERLMLVTGVACRTDVQTEWNLP